MPVCQVDDININYQEYGQGFPIVLAHPFSASLEFWAPQVAKLSSRYRVIASATNSGAILISERVSNNSEFQKMWAETPCLDILKTLAQRVLH